MQPFFAPEAFPPRTSRPPGIAWSDGRLPNQVEAFVLCHLLELADGRASRAPAPRKNAHTTVKRSRTASAAEEVGDPGSPPLAVMIAAQSMRFACGACIDLLTVGEKTMLHKTGEIHGIRRECMHYMCGRYAGAHERASALGAMLRGVASVPSMLPYVRFLPRDYYCPWALNEFTVHCTAADGAVMLEALLDRAAAQGWDLVTMWPTNFDFPDTLLRCVVKSGNVEYMRVVLRRGLFDPMLRTDGVVAHARKEGWSVSHGMLEVLAQYLQ